MTTSFSCLSIGCGYRFVPLFPRVGKGFCDVGVSIILELPFLPTFQAGLTSPTGWSSNLLEGLPHPAREAGQCPIVSNWKLLTPPSPQRPFYFILRQNLLNAVQSRSIHAWRVSHLFLNKHIPEELVYSQIAMSVDDPPVLFCQSPRWLLIKI